ncbi:MAG: sigma-70 family RNA polymerase sigma factor [Verrucomicrobiota bacterium]
MPEIHDPESEFVRLLTEHQAALRHYVISLLPGESSAADVAQQANTTIWKKREDFELGTNFKAWIFSIARFEVLNFRKKQARDSRLVFGDELCDLIEAEIPNHEVAWDSRQDALRGCLSQLKDRDRELIRHRYYEPTQLADYAAEVGRSVGSLKVTLHRIRNRLQTCIEARMLKQQKLS